MTDSSPEGQEPHITDTGWNIAGDQMQKGTGLQKDPNIAEDLRWLYRHAHDMGWSLKETASRMGVDYTTLYRVFLGKYRGNNNQVLTPPAKLISRLRTIRNQDKQRVLDAGKERIKTPTVERIWTVCQKVWRQGAMGYIIGDSHIGKTFALVWFRDENNHGTTIYVRCSAMSGQQELLRLFAEALNISPNTAIYRLKPRILSALDSTNLIIVDEFHQLTHTYLKGHAMKCIELLREIHDRSGAAMLLCGTNVVDHEIHRGHDAMLLKQIDRRGIVKCRLPKALSVGDVRAICNAHGLTDDAIEEARKWKDLPTTDHYGILADIAHDHGVKRLILTLQDAALLARKKKRELDWKDVERAHAIYCNLETVPEV